MSLAVLTAGPLVDAEPQLAGGDVKYAGYTLQHDLHI